MSENKFTPGPWKVEENPFGVYTTTFFLIGSKKESWIAESKGPHVGPKDIEECKANAKLIAAAPELLEALQNLENDDNSIPEHAWKMVQDAIKQATE